MTYFWLRASTHYLWMPPFEASNALSQFKVHNAANWPIERKKRIKSLRYSMIISVSVPQYQNLQKMPPTSKPNNHLTSFMRQMKLLMNLYEYINLQLACICSHDCSDLHCISSQTTNNEIKHYSELQCITHQNTRALFKYELTTISSNMFWIILYCSKLFQTPPISYAFRKCLTMSRNKVFVRWKVFEIWIIDQTYTRTYPNVALLEIHIEPE